MIMAKKQSGPKDFVDYFFQKEGTPPNSYDIHRL